VIPKIFAIRIGSKYGQDVENYINSKIPNVNWIREESDGLKLQWNKLKIMNLNIDDPVLVIDIDMLFINNYMDAILYPIERGEFLTANSWWKDTDVGQYNLNGGFQKYYPKDCKYIYDEFMKKPDFWMKYFLENKITTGDVNGEQFFVETFARKKLKLKFLPDSWFVRYDMKFELKNDSYDRMMYYYLNTKHPSGWLYLDGCFNDDIKIVHFMNAKFDSTIINKFDPNYLNFD
jgi:hypothetical protein